MNEEPTMQIPAQPRAEAARVFSNAQLPPKHTTETITQGIKPVFSKTEDLVAFGKDNLEALTAAGKIWAAGVQDLTKQYADTAKDSIEESMATFKALTSVKSVKEAIELQTNYSKSMVSKVVAESNKLTEASLRLTEQAMAPITARLAAAVGGMSKAA